MESELVKLIEEIYNKYKGYPYIMLTKTVAEYNFCIHQLYVELFNNIEKIFNDILLLMDELLIKKPELIYCSNDILNGNIIFKDEIGNIHYFKYCSSKTKEMFIEFKKKAQLYLSEENKQLKLLNKSIIGKK